MIKKLFVIVAIVAFLCVFPGATNAMGAELGQIAYSVENASGDTELWSWNPSTQSSMRHLSGMSWVERIEYSPSGELLLAKFWATADSRSKLLVLDSSGEVVRQVTGDCYDARFDPSGTKIIYAGWSRGAVYETAASTADGESSAVRKLVQTSGYTLDHMPNLSSGGTRLAWIHHEWGSDYFVSLIDNFNPALAPYRGENRYVRNLNPLITIVGSGDSYHDEDIETSWNSESTKLAYATRRGRSVIHIAELPPVGETTPLATADVAITDITLDAGLELSSYPAFSPHGKRIVFSTYDGIHIMHEDGTGLTRLTAEDSETDPLWISDSNHLIYGANFSFEEIPAIQIISMTGASYRIYPNSAEELGGSGNIGELAVSSAFRVPGSAYRLFSSVSSLDSKFKGLRWISYSPTNFDPERGQFPSLASIKRDLRVLRQAGFTGIITYGSDGTLASIPRLARRLRFKGVVMGVWRPQITADVATARAAKNFVDGYVVGNEGLYEGYSAERLNSTMQHLRAATGKPVTTSEQIDDYYWDPDLREIGDFLLPNAHPYFQGILTPALAAAWTNTEYSRLRSLTAKRVFLKEAGLPSAGDVGLSEAAQASYYSALVASDTSFSWFEGMDQPWKSRSGTAVESHWGLFRSDRSPKQVVETLRRFR